MVFLVAGTAVFNVGGNLACQVGGTGSGRRWIGIFRVLVERATAARLRVDVDASTRKDRRDADALEGIITALLAAAEVDSAKVALSAPFSMGLPPMRRAA